MLQTKFRKAQSTAEYVIVLGLIIAAVVAMQTYIKRGFQARIKDAVDFNDQGNQIVNEVAQLDTTGQYEPYYLRSNFTRDRTSNETENLEASGASTRNVSELSTSHGYQNMVNQDTSD
ncbi:MAG: hypothetical protein Q8N85_04485 [Candidatus Omnitrophota bacterium]|nr:hypothetical protein [Candidatus Omnitrophota bacterium]